MFLFIATGILGAVTLGLVIVGFLQVRDAKKSIETAAKSAAAAEKAATVAETQTKDTRILQRAYLSVEPRGINPMVGQPDLLVAHVKIVNAGNLPARQVKWRIESLFDSDGQLEKFSIKGKPDGNNVVNPKGEMLQGNDDFISRAKMLLEKDTVRRHVGSKTAYL
jgi:hypothetical protein